MALVLDDRVRETANVSGLGDAALAGAVTGFQSFASGVGNGNTAYYTISTATGPEWEVGIGTYTAATNTFSRDTVYSSSNNDNKVTFSPGVKDIFVTLPASKGSLVVTALQPSAIGVTVQGYSANLAGWSGITTSSKQDALVSGTNIKTINGSSVLGSGDLTVVANDTIAKLCLTGL